MFRVYASRTYSWTAPSNLQNDLSILKLTTKRNAPHLGKHRGIYLGINHLAIELEPYEKSFRQWLEEQGSFRQL